MKSPRPTASHVPIINHDTAACSCRAWPGPARQDGETIGNYTLRAAAQHEAHRARVLCIGADLFTPAEDVISPFGLFAQEANQ